MPASIRMRILPNMRSQLTLILSLLILASITRKMQAAGWSGADWTLSPALTTRLGYDSNLFARDGSPDDAFHEIEPKLIWTRRPSATMLSVEAAVRSVAFFHWPEENSIDSSLRAKYRYPEEESLLASREMDAFISRASVANSDVGRRVRETEFFFRWEETVPLTAKTAVQGRVSARRSSYNDDDLNRNDRVDAGLAIAFLHNEKLDLGAGYDLSLSRSAPSDARESTRRVENALTIRGRGEFAPNVSGRLYVGLANANYSGAQNRSGLDIVAGGNLEWLITERRRLTATVDRGVYFSPEGDAVTSSSAGVELHQDLSTGISARVGIKIIRAVYRREAVFRSDLSFPLRAGVDYQINPRFTAGVEGGWSEHRSDVVLYNYHRTDFAAWAAYRF